jgi:ankyrin repeat protein
LACDQNAVLLVEQLVTKGALLDVQMTPNLNTALHLASSRGHAQIVTLLHRAGAQTKPNQFGNFPAHSAAMAGAFDVLKILKENGSLEVDATNTRGSSALHFAIHGESLPCVSFLLENGFSQNVADEVR